MEKIDNDAAVKRYQIREMGDRLRWKNQTLIREEQGSAGRR